MPDTLPSTQREDFAEAEGRTATAAAPRRRVIAVHFALEPLGGGTGITTCYMNSDHTPMEVRRYLFSARLPAGNIEYFLYDGMRISNNVTFEDLGTGDKYFLGIRLQALTEREQAQDRGTLSTSCTTG